jgi:hypothetical protein
VDKRSVNVSVDVQDGEPRRADEGLRGISDCISGCVNPWVSGGGAARPR